MSVRAIAYARAAPEETAADPLTLCEQYDTISAAIAQRRWDTCAWALDRNVDSPVAANQRPALGRALEDLAAGAAGALVVARLDRVSHSVRIWADLVDRSYQQRWAIVVVDEGFDLPSTSAETAAALLAAAAREEHQWLSTRTRAGLAAAQATGTRLGRPVEHTPQTRQLVAELRAAGQTLQQIADQLAADGTPTPRGGQWHRSTIHQLLQSTHLDEQAAANKTQPDTVPTPTVRFPLADQADRAADLDRKLPDSYNLAPPTAPQPPHQIAKRI